TLTPPLKTVEKHFSPITLRVDHTPRYNIAPTQEVPVVTAVNGPRELVVMKWGLVPPWSRDEKSGPRLINARAETLEQKPSFRGSFKNKRCLIPADGFMEWKKNRNKIPFYITLKSGEPFAFAGLWAEWKGTDRTLQTFTIITTPANALLQPLHDRMPLILAPRDYEAWLDPSTAPKDLRPLLVPFSADALRVVEISPKINSPHNDSPECLKEA
ncbi:MAG: hypothetical protein GWM98_23640, partial [Nitrospinaceae bacterium]|nr:SOS response-associated peptidase [Nitrospinaceae bacterium]NIR56903.1 SOS response-associated peptidase [Nitrospinaceae bacterium]NIS87365.1 SOS response-associated peptidase [Nitrospinaceae bacterium]NIT84220.1 SOS response-associated peptidase [Nitrospinaceae bacterium]NIU46405.1 SOS response-associated peptidase [Nitrospinaceae bacterium]